MTTVLILAAGECPEWVWSHYTKHTVPIAGEPMIVRTVRQLREMDYDPVVVTHLSKIERLDVCCFKPARYKTYSDTLLSTKELWNGQVVILNGDVVWADSCLQFVFSNLEDIKFFGEAPSAMLGFTFSPAYYDRVEAATIATYNPWQGHFYSMLSLMCGEQTCSWHTIIPPDGITYDFDDTHTYESWLADREWARAGNPVFDGPKASGMTAAQLKQRVEELAPWKHNHSLPLGVNTQSIDEWMNNISAEEFHDLISAGAFPAESYPGIVVVGASDGYEALWFINNKHSTKISTIDLDDHCVAQQFLLCDLYDLYDKWIPAVFDAGRPFCSYNWSNLVLVMGVVHHLDGNRLATLFNSCASSLKPGVGGTLVVLDYADQPVAECALRAGFKSVKKLDVACPGKAAWIAYKD